MKHPAISALALMGTLSVLALLSAVSPAQAATPSWDKIWTPNSVTACKKLPLSEWGICKANVVAREQGSLAAVQQQYPASYLHAVAACDTLPLRQQGICRAEASLKGPQPVASATLEGGAQTASNALDARYRKALDACRLLPRDEHTTCESDAALMNSSIG